VLRDNMFEPPFRWNLTNQTHLGGLVRGEKAETYQGFLNHLLVCCSRTLPFAGDSDLVFVGRSPESIFDHLSGLLFDTSWFDRLHLLQFSMRWQDEAEIRRRYPKAIASMRDYLRHLQLDPSALITRKRPVSFIDLVVSGDTFGRLVNLLHSWSRESGVDWSAVKRKLRLIGITERTKSSPKTWRWHLRAEWTTVLQRGSIKNVSIPRDLWGYLGDYQLKVTESFTPARWAHPDSARPIYSDQQLKALRLAYDLFEYGKTPTRRAELAAQLGAEPSMKLRWFRGLVQEIRR
jgi:hypothetical protein